ncbi:anthranilate synthase component I [Heliorestis convoluta]|uniref:Anthranilate synthase component 1 n=1 Tax=Heliorestis convoluta TaxID=356322 RepID=A0A5Q2N1L6_9FIRM|nr:anthranilate synthase component I [Heliorestis convoluta]QGG47723.1 anthranilate synthase component I [Heliorestis convoluta]
MNGIIGCQDFMEQSKKYRYIPMHSTFSADLDTPITFFHKLTGHGLGYLLESVERGTVLGRYSFVGAEPMAFFTWPVDDNKGKEACTEKRDPLLALRHWLEQLQVAPLSTEGELPRFYGGAVGYFAYDLIRYYERLPERAVDDRSLPEASLMVTRYTLVIDHLRHKATLVYLAEAGDEEAYHFALEQLQEKLHLLKAQLEPSSFEKALLEKQGQTFAGKAEVTSTFNQETFCRAVDKCKEYIAAGDVFQVVLSQRFSRPLRVHPFNIYRSLRSLNPSPYLFYLNLPGLTLAGSSPELLVRAEGNHLETHPIAGTRRRGKDEAADRELAEDLLSDPKERAEHLMLVDLGRNDIGRVSRTGTVKVDRFMEVEKYSHVIHLVSKVTGEIAEDKTGLDALASVMPAGTLSGAPKVRAMEIIDELEPVRRGPYGGAVGYLGFDGNLDSCITIRTMVMHNNQVDIQVGAGVVADSVPILEYEETMNKARALFEAIDRAEGEFL